MKTPLSTVIMCMVLVSTLSVEAFAGSAIDERCREAIKLFKKTDSGIGEFFRDAYGYAIYPRVGKGGMGIGAARGKGLVYRGGSKVGRTSLHQLTIGFQLGGQIYQEAIFFDSKRSFDDFKGGNFELSAQASAIAASAGVAATAKYSHGVAIFTLGKAGLMYEATVGGQKFSYKPY
ncbi:MAG: YSC84-related protein [Thermoanaerobaculia bacterium]